MKTQAAIAWPEAGVWSVEEVELDPPKDREVRVRIAACGVCRTDEHLLTRELPFPLPTIGGHEGSGVIEAVGSGVRAVDVGDHVVLTMPICGRCPSCAAGQSNLCDNGRYLFSGRQIGDQTSRHHARGKDVGVFCGMGAFAEHTVVSEDSVVKIRANIPLKLAALVGCSVITGWGSAVYVGGVSPGDDVAVVGIGGVGISALQGARVAGAKRIFAIDPMEFKRTEAKRLGATHTYASVFDALDHVRTVTWGRMCNKVIMSMDVGDGSMMREVLALTAKSGVVVIANVHPASEQSVSLSLQDLTFGQKQLRGSLFGAGNARYDVPKMVGLFEEGLLDLESMVTSEYRLDTVNRAFEDLRSGKNVRGVLVME